MTRQKVLLYNPQAVFHTMPLALLALGSALDPAALRRRASSMGGSSPTRWPACCAEADGALCLGVSVLTGAPIRDALRDHARRQGAPARPADRLGRLARLALPDATRLDEPSVDVTVQGAGRRDLPRDRRGAGGRRVCRGLSVGCTYRASDGDARRRTRRARSRRQRPSRPTTTTCLPVERYFTLKGERQLDYISSTGCLFRCAFCADPFVYNRTLGRAAPERIGRGGRQPLAALPLRRSLVPGRDLLHLRPSACGDRRSVHQRTARAFTWTATMRADQGDRLRRRDVRALQALRPAAGDDRRRVRLAGDARLDEKDITIEEVFHSAEKCVRHGIARDLPLHRRLPGRDRRQRARLASTWPSACAP